MKRLNKKKFFRHFGFLFPIFLGIECLVLNYGLDYAWIRWILAAIFSTILLACVAASFWKAVTDSMEEK